MGCGCWESARSGSPAKHRLLFDPGVAGRWKSFGGPFLEIYGRELPRSCDADARRDCRDEVLVNADVETGLMELLLNIDFAEVDERLKVSSHPRDLGARKAAFGDVDGLAGQVGRGGVPGRGRGVAVSADETLLDGDGANR